MAGNRLEHWSTLSRDELARRVEQEMRRTDLSFAEQQLLDAARGRLMSWRAPRSNRTEANMRDDNDQKTATAPATEPTTPTPAPAPTAPRPGPAPDAADVPASPATPVSPVNRPGAKRPPAAPQPAKPTTPKPAAKKPAAKPATKKPAAKKPAAKKPAAKKSTSKKTAANGSGRIPDDHVLKVFDNAKNPHPVDSAPWKRLEAMRKFNGMTRKAIISRSGMKTTTPQSFVKAKMGQFVPK